MRQKFTLQIALLCLVGCGQEPTKISKVEMKLSAYGVESDDYPNIDVYIDFIHDSSNCAKSYYNPKNKSSAYQLSRTGIESVLRLLNDVHMDTPSKKYSVGRTDQPTSYMTIYTNRGNYKIEDYGLKGPRPLQDIYRIVYKF